MVTLFEKKIVEDGWEGVLHWLIKGNTTSTGMRSFGKPKTKSRELILKVNNIIPLFVISNMFWYMYDEKLVRTYHYFLN